ncbi:tyrosine-protein phosphatase 10D-like isoform X3 [Palaemon carinicauda]|uniref:tyrosine-protein phosphatase 10D-like isoform X3 n=1 Tax=Palaemon carinicauda TaxID=392227 RepID=UPI0035B5DB69
MCARYSSSSKLSIASVCESRYCTITLAGYRCDGGSSERHEGIKCFRSRCRNSFPPDRFPDKDGFYRLDYWPPQGAPPPNTTFTPAKVVEGIELTRVLPGTKYDFQLCYCNDTLSDYPRWTASIATGPNAPGRFIMWYRNEMAILALWHRPHPAGIYSHYQILYQEVETFNGDSKTKVVKDRKELLLVFVSHFERH